MDRTSRLKEEFESLRVDLLAEINTVDDRMIRPAMEAKDYLQPMKKVIKKRDDKKVRNPVLSTDRSHLRLTLRLRSSIMNGTKVEWIHH